MIKYLIGKTDKTSYLTHAERSLLRYTLGHLGEEGIVAIHKIVSGCYNYRKEVTDRHLRKIPPSPISCPRIREIHPEITASVGCDCRFRISGKGYPTPLLHALKPWEIRGFRSRSAISTVSKPQNRKHAAEEEMSKAAEEIVMKIAERKRQIKKLDTALERLHQDLSTIFERLGVDHLDLSIGVLRSVSREDGQGLDFRIEV